MALSQTTLNESVLSNSERNVLRQIYRISLLADARKLLSNSRSTVVDTNAHVSAQTEKSKLGPKAAIDEIDNYLVSCIQRILNTVKVPKSQGPDEHPQ